MQKFILKPKIDMYEGIIVDKESTFEYKDENVKQTLKNLVFRSVTKVKGEGFESQQKTTIILKEGELLLFMGEGRGYIKPVESLVTVQEAIEDLSCLTDL
jgi:hypothetical protein